MTSIEEHYEQLLAENYSWMAGGQDVGVERSRRAFEKLEVKATTGAKSIDLGCGSGFQSIALADLGYEVVSVDTSQALLDELAHHANGRNIETVLADMRDVDAYREQGPFSLVVCQGDSILSLESAAEVEKMLTGLMACLQLQATVVISFRSLLQPLTGIDRAIPVRLDDDRLWTTFLEYEQQHVVVNDQLFVKDDSGWRMEKGSYKKLRLDPQCVVDQFNQLGFDEVTHRIDQGVSTIVAKRN